MAADTPGYGRRERAASLSLRRRLRRAWRLRLRPIWREARLFVFFGLAAAVLVIGVVGYRRAHYLWSDSLYGAISDFVPGAFLLDLDGNNWQIAVVRDFAPIITGVAVLRGLLGIARDQMQIVWLRFTAREHVVMVGLGTVGALLSEALHDAGYKVVAIEVDPENDAVGSARDLGITVIVGSALDVSVLRGARVRRATNLVVATGQDELNLDVLAAVRGLVPLRGNRVLTAFVQLDDRSLTRMLRAEAFRGGHHPGLRVEFFDVLEIATRRVLDDFVPFDPVAHSRAPKSNVLVVGFGTIAPNLVLEIARRWRAAESEGQTLRITLADSEAEEHRDELSQHHPELGDLCELEALDVNIDSPAFERGDVALNLPDDYEISAIYVCRSPDTRAISTAFALNGRPETHAAPKAITLTDTRIGVASTIEDSDRPGGRLHTFSVFVGALGPDLLLSGMNEQIARATHEGYVRSQRALGKTGLDNPAIVPWEELPESLKQQNRRSADHVGVKLEAAGCRLIPASLSIENVFAFSEDEIEELAKLEHDRWVDDLRRDGWKLTDGTKDPERRLHPLLVDWSELSEPEREKDRVNVRELPAMLAAAGFEIHRGSASLLGEQADRTLTRAGRR